MDSLEVFKPGDPGLWEVKMIQEPQKSQGKGGSPHLSFLCLLSQHLWALDSLGPLSLFEGHLLSTQGLQGSETGSRDGDGPYFPVLPPLSPMFLRAHTGGPGTPSLHLFQVPC